MGKLYFDLPLLHPVHRVYACGIYGEYADYNINLH